MNAALKWVDTHCHLEMLKEPAEQALEQGRQAGLDHCLTIGTSDGSNKKVLDFCQTFEGVYGTLGIHPHQAGETVDAHLEFIDQNLSHPKVVALGECGLDYHYDFSEPKEQKPVFTEQLKLAIKHQMPVVIHSRQADKDTLACIEAVGPEKLKGVFHSYTGTVATARKILDMGFYMSFNGICTFPTAETVREILALVPKDRLLLETDSPYLAPVPIRGKPNLPGHVRLVGKFVAQQLGLSEATLAEQVYQNGLDLFEKVPR